MESVVLLLLLEVFQLHVSVYFNDESETDEQRKFPR